MPFETAEQWEPWRQHQIWKLFFFFEKNSYYFFFILPVYIVGDRWASLAQVRVRLWQKKTGSCCKLVSNSSCGENVATVWMNVAVSSEAHFIIWVPFVWLVWTLLWPPAWLEEVWLGAVQLLMHKHQHGSAMCTWPIANKTISSLQSVNNNGGCLRAQWPRLQSDVLGIDRHCAATCPLFADAWAVCSGVLFGVDSKALGTPQWVQPSNTCSGVLAYQLQLLNYYTLYELEAPQDLIHEHTPLWNLRSLSTGFLSIPRTRRRTFGDRTFNGAAPTFQKVGVEIRLALSMYSALKECLFTQAFGS